MARPSGRGGVETPPPAVGVRLAWPSVPAGLRYAVEQQLGGRVVEAVTQPGGFSPGVAARLKTATGTRAFVKAVGPELNPESPGIHRAEARIAAALPEGVPAPRLLGYFDEDGWVVLVFEDIEGAAPVLPWEAAELARVLDAVAELAVALTPAPIDAPPSPTASVRNFRAGVVSWRPSAAAAMTWPASTPGRAVTWRTWPRWRPAGRPLPKVLRWSMQTCGQTTYC